MAGRTPGWQAFRTPDLAIRNNVPMSVPPVIASALATSSDAVTAVRSACEEITARMEGRPVTLAVVFVSHDLAGDPWTLLDELRRHLEPEHLVGTVTDAVIAGDRELEGTPGVCVWAASLPDAETEVVHFVSEPDTAPTFLGAWPSWVTSEPDTTLIVLSDPFTFPVEVLLAEHRHAGLPPIVGGQASGGTRAGDHALFLDGEVHFDGAVGIAMTGVTTIPVVAQGAVPVGPDMVITGGGGTVIEELAGVRAYDRLMMILEDLAEESTPFSGAPMMGIVINENLPEYTRNDFLVRALQGHDPATGSVHIGEHIRVGQTVRLHSLSGVSADEDLTLTLEETLRRMGDRSAAGVLLFTCNGRGRRLFEGESHDAKAVTAAFGAPLGGMFANGEIGPVAGETFLHGFTASILVFVTPD